MAAGEQLLWHGAQDVQLRLCDERFAQGAIRVVERCGDVGGIPGQLVADVIEDLLKRVLRPLGLPLPSTSMLRIWMSVASMCPRASCSL